MNFLRLALVSFVLGGVGLLLFPFGIGQILGAIFSVLFVVLLLIGLALVEKPASWSPQPKGRLP